MAKKLFYFILILFIFLFLTKDIKALQFEKYQSNPLSITFTNNYVNQHQANIFFEDNIYKGIITIHKPPETHHSLGYFESVDGINWIMKKEILNTGSDLSNPSILKTETGYLLFLTRYDDNTIYRIYRSSCDLEFNCSASLMPMIFSNETNSSENNGVFAGHTFQQNDRTYMFFGAWGTNGFKIKLAYSNDLLSWQRCPNEFLYGGDGPFPYQNDNELYLFFHRSDSSGIKYAKTTLPLSCDSLFTDQGYILTRDREYDQKHLVFPSILGSGGNLRLYYSGLGTDSQWRLNLACTGQSCIYPTPIVTHVPTPTEVPTPTQIPTPTPVPEKKPIIIIPGFLASWNKDALTHNISQPQSKWQLNPMAHEYDGLVNTLKKLGYEENKNLLIFTYDWRKPVLDIVEDLKVFINDHYSSTSNFQIIGHSLGGLIARVYIQKYNSLLVDSLITAGSPHKGATVSYKIVEAGEIERFNDYLWLAVKMIITLNKNNIETDKQTINRLIPVMKDLFPVYNFLKKNNVEINAFDMEVKNELLPYFNSILSSISNISTIVGEKGNTLKGFNVENPTYLDKLFGNYPDGRPISSFSEIGDHTVLSTSASINSPTILNYEHGELVYKKDAIKKILELFNIPTDDLQIVEGKGTIIDSSLLFLIKSPATMEVIFNGKTYPETNGLIFIENAQNGQYQLRVKGTASGNYEVIIGQIGKNNDVWDSIFGEAKNFKTDDYNIQYNSETPKSYFETTNNLLSLFDDLIYYLKTERRNWLIIKKVELAKRFYQINKKPWIIEILNSVKHEIIKNKDFIALEKLENIEIKLSHKSNKKINYKKINEIENKINKLKQPVNEVVLQQIINRLDILKNEKTTTKDILFDSISELMKIVKSN